MTLSLPRSAQPHIAKPLAVFAALAWTALTFGAAMTPAPAQAADSGAFYRAQLTAPAPTPHAIASGVVWACKGTECAAGKGTSRPAIVCARLAKEVGPLASFAAGDKSLDAEALARCNAK